MSGVGLPPELVDRTFPFHVAFDGAGQVLQVGSVLQRLCPALVGSRIDDVLEIIRPEAMAFEVARIQQHPRTVFVV